ncbi:MAG: class I SAM-dependent methyltransferase [Spirochaetaceae bacterium]|nr:class I SAM-dependent methyltransferase [Spirochaetaceae bacterium]
MDSIQNILEYYDELFPVSSEQKMFYEEILDSFQIEPKVLSIGCGTGAFEHYLSRRNCNVTGIDYIPGLLESATRRHRQPGCTVRFFQMTIVEMAQYLGKGFYNLISCINNRLPPIPNASQMEKFFRDCRELLSSTGYFVLQIPNYPYYTCQQVGNLPVSESIRSKLYTKLITDDNGTRMLQQVETSNGRLVTVRNYQPVYPLASQDVEELALDTGFHGVEFYSDFSKHPFIPESSPNLICVIKA